MTAPAFTSALSYTRTSHEWAGTYATILGKLVDDFLEDGPVSARVKYEADFGVHQVTGRLERRTSNSLIVETASRELRTIGMDSIFHFEVE